MNNHAFIDSNNVYQAIKHLGWKLDHARFRTYLYDKYNVQKAYIFIGYISGNESLYKSIVDAGYIPVFKPTLTITRGNSESVKGNTDAELVLHCARGMYKDEFDKAVIITSDGDFYCLIKELVTHDKLHRLIIPNRKRYSQLLKEFSTDMDFLDALRLKIGHKNAGIG